MPEHDPQPGRPNPVDKDKLPQTIAEIVAKL